MRLQSPGILDLRDLASLLFNGKLIEGERCCLVLYLQVPLIDPHGNIFPYQAPLAIQAPVLEPDVPMAIDLTSELCSVQRTREYLFRKGSAQYSPQYLCGAVPPILARLVSVVSFGVVVHL